MMRRRLLCVCVGTLFAVLTVYAGALLQIHSSANRLPNPRSSLAKLASSMQQWETERKQGHPRGAAFGGVIVSINQLRGVGKTITRDHVEAVLGLPDRVYMIDGHYVGLYFTDGSAPRSSVWVLVYDRSNSLYDVMVNNSDAVVPVLDRRAAQPDK
jgi:hypothetical protein